MWQDDEPHGGLPEGLEMPGDEEKDYDEPGTLEGANAGRPMKRSQAKRGVPGQEQPILYGKTMTTRAGRKCTPQWRRHHRSFSEKGTPDCFIAKLCVHTWTRHATGMSVTRNFPRTWHMLLSGPPGAKIKVCKTVDDDDTMVT
jgi:hypothetical protein